MTLMEVTHVVLSVQEIFISAIISSQAQAFKVTLVVNLDSLKACLLQRKVEICCAANILIAVKRVVAVCLIERSEATALLIPFCDSFRAQKQDRTN